MKTSFNFITAIAIFILASCSKSDSTNPPGPAVTAPVLGTTMAASSVSGTSAISGGNVTSDGGANITARGVCWSVLPNPVIANGHTSDGTGTGTFISNISGLLPGTLYYVRAYATNSAGTSYGTGINFTTVALSSPIISGTISITGISDVTALSGGNITGDGGAAITARGICWNTATNPTTSNFKTIDGSGIGSFTSNLAGLTASTQYYVRSYATNSIGTTYGPELNFTSFFAIGSTYLGGKLAYILTAGDPGYDPNIIHGLVITPTDITPGANNWLGSGGYSITGAVATVIGSGNANTNTIVNAQGTGTYAAKLAADLVLNGYSDWYLPSKDELVKIHTNKVALGITASMYWSSSEINNQEVWVQYFGAGAQLTSSNKANGGQTRGVRNF